MIDQNLARYLQEAMQRFHPVRTPAGDVRHLDLSSVQLEVMVAGIRVTVTVGPEEIVQAYVPLMRLIRQSWCSAGRRILVGLAGVPGSGKSITAAILARLWRTAGAGPALAVVAMDGWHLTNEELNRRPFVAADGSTVPLRRRKGSPPSFDAVGLAAALRRIRRARSDVPIPVYDRNLHEPVPGGTVVPADTGIVWIEGNYVLLDEGPWANVSGQFDLSLWLDIDPAACREGIIARHVSGGMSPEEAADKYAENDWPNTQIALTSRDRAAWLIRCSPSHTVLGLSRTRA
jgi:pantothenate kinase